MAMALALALALVLANITMEKKKRLRSKCDRLWFEVCLKPKCEVCGSTGILQVHHFWYKGSYAHLRYDLDNGISLCQGCHFVLHHQDPKKITDQIIAKRGKKWYNKLKKKALERNNISFQTIGYYTDILAELKNKQ